METLTSILSEYSKLGKNEIDCQIDINRIGYERGDRMKTIWSHRFP